MMGTSCDESEGRRGFDWPSAPSGHMAGIWAGSKDESAGGRPKKRVQRRPMPPRGWSFLMRWAVEEFEAVCGDSLSL